MQNLTLCICRFVDLPAFAWTNFFLSKSQHNHMRFKDKLVIKDTRTMGEQTYAQLLYKSLPFKKSVQTKGSLQIKKCSKLRKKSKIFLTPPPGCFGLFWIWEQLEIWWSPPLQKKNISLRRLNWLKITLKLTYFLFNRSIYSLYLHLGKKWISEY